VKATGDCYAAAFRWMFDHCTFNPKIDVGEAYLVHAEVEGQGPLEGVRFGHAFILVMPEDTEPTPPNIQRFGSVIDRSNGRNIEMPAALYFAIGRIFDHGNYYLYDCDDTMRLVVDYNHTGPWDLETSSGL